MTYQNIIDLQNRLKEAADAYYNTGIEVMSNEEYDRLFDELRIAEEQYGIPVQNRFTSTVGANTKASSKYPKVTHKYPALSLDKSKSVDELITIQSSLPEGLDADLCLSWKLDGMTLQLTYEDGNLVSAITRGNGEVGQEITPNIIYITGIPQHINVSGECVVRGEVTMSEAEFERINEECGGMYNNARNLANGTLLAEDENIIRNRQLNFRAFKLRYSDDPIFPTTFDGRLDTLKMLGFDVVDHERVKVRDLHEAIQRWSETGRIEALGTPVDGLVIATNDCNFTKNLTPSERYLNTHESMAFKWQDKKVHTTLREIKYQVSRTGLVNPVAVFDPVYLEGSEVTKASLFNMSYIKDRHLQSGDEITVYKANMIIPQVADNVTFENMSAEDKQARIAYGTHCPSRCPCCNDPLVVNRTNSIITLHCLNTSCVARKANTFAHMFSKDGLNIEGMDIKTIELLINSNLLTNPSDIYSLTKEQIMHLDGFKEKSTQNLLNAIEKSKTTDFVSLLYAMGIKNIGKKQAKTIKAAVEEYHKTVSLPPEQDTYINCLAAMVWEGYDFSKVEGIGPVRAQALTDWVNITLVDVYSRYLPGTEQTDVIELLTLTDKWPEKELIPKSLPLLGMTFVITGDVYDYKNRAELQGIIESLGGKCSGSVSSKTTYLINNDIESTSNKNKTAKALGVPIISEKDFEMLLNRINASEIETLEEPDITR